MAVIENRASNLLDVNPKRRGKRRVEVGDGLGVVKTVGIQIVDPHSLCEGGIDFGVVSSDFGGFVYHDERGNMHPGRRGWGEIVPEGNLHVPRVTLSSRVAIVSDEDEYVDRSLRRQHPIPDTDEIGNRLRMPNIQNQGREGIPVCLLWEKWASALPRGFCGRREGRQAASGCLSLPGPGILMSKTSNSFLKGDGYPIYRR